MNESKAIGCRYRTSNSFYGLSQYPLRRYVKMSDRVNAFTRLIHAANKLATTNPTTCRSPLKNRRLDVGATAAGPALNVGGGGGATVE
jgi:hypothetical protein